MSEANKAMVQRLYDALNKGDLSILDQALDDKMVEHDLWPGQAPGKEGVKQFFQTMMTAFPDFKFSVEDMIAEGDKVFIRYVATGTHKAEFLGMPGTGKSVSVPGADFLRVVNGKIVEHWGVTDSGLMMQQLSGGS